MRISEWKQFLKHSWWTTNQNLSPRLSSEFSKVLVCRRVVNNLKLTLEASSQRPHCYSTTVVLRTIITLQYVHCITLQKRNRISQTQYFYSTLSDADNIISRTIQDPSSVVAFLTNSKGQTAVHTNSFFHARFVSPSSCAILRAFPAFSALFSNDSTSRGFEHG